MQIHPIPWQKRERRAGWLADVAIVSGAVVVALIIAAVLLALLHTCGCVKGAVQVGPSDWPRVASSGEWRVASGEWRVESGEQAKSDTETRGHGDSASQPDDVQTPQEIIDELFGDLETHLSAPGQP